MDGGGYKILPINLALGGQSWSGWTFGPWGRARDWRLQAPDGAHYTAGEIADVRRLQMDVEYLRARVSLIDDAAALYLAGEECTIIREAVSILDRVLPKKRRGTK